MVNDWKSTTVVEIKENNTFHSFTVSAGIEPQVNDLLFLRARFSGGFSLRNHELLFNIIFHVSSRKLLSIMRL